MVLSNGTTLASCTLSTLPHVLTVDTQYDVLHRLLELLPTDYFRKDNRALHVMPQELMVNIARSARAIIFSEPNVVQVEPPVVICGDLHGQYYDLLNIFSRRPPHGWSLTSHGGVAPGGADLTAAADGISGPPTKKTRTEADDASTAAAGHTTATAPPAVQRHRYVFLGDYVDRGPRSIEVMVTLLALKILHPDQIYLLRGNHEDEHVASMYGFFHECKGRYSSYLFKVFADVFRCLPAAGVVGKHIFCVHGGIGPGLRTIGDIPDARPCDVPHEGVICDLLWSDPEVRLPMPSDGLYAPSPRNVSFVFSPEALDHFLKSSDMDLVVRAHQVIEEGFQFFPPHQRKLITIFGATNYTGEFLNRGAALEVSRDMECSILTFVPPREDQRKFLKATFTW